MVVLAHVSETFEAAAAPVLEACSLCRGYDGASSSTVGKDHGHHAYRAVLERDLSVRRRDTVDLDRDRIEVCTIRVLADPAINVVVEGPVSKLDESLNADAHDPASANSSRAIRASSARGTKRQAR